MKQTPISGLKMDLEEKLVSLVRSGNVDEALDAISSGVSFKERAHLQNSYCVNEMLSCFFC